MKHAQKKVYYYHIKESKKASTNMLLHFIMILSLFTLPFTMALGTLQGSNLKAVNNIAKPGCKTHCGNITVPYPFGIREDKDCSLDESFYLTCNSAYDPPRLFIRSSTIRIYNISESELRIFTRVSYKCYNRDGDEDVGQRSAHNMNGLFNFSTKNILTVIGCDEYALITGLREDHYSSGCIGLCSNLSEVAAGECSGNGCCQTTIKKDLDSYAVTLNTFRNHTDVWSINPCGYAFLSEEGTFRFNGASDLISNYSDFLERVSSTIHIVLDWVIAPNRSCSEATECKENSSCYNVESGGYRCRCNQGYEGNPYLDQGCQALCFHEE